MSDYCQTPASPIYTVVDMSTGYRLAPIDPEAADALRIAGGTRYIADAKPGYPCRQCLQDAEIGETLVLVAYNPFTVDSPYRSRSPIFLHERACTPHTGSVGLPNQLTSRQLSIRAFDREAMMLDAAVIDGIYLEEQLRRFFENDAVSEIHVHNATRGCWATSVIRLP